MPCSFTQQIVFTYKCKIYPKLRFVISKIKFLKECYLHNIHNLYSKYAKFGCKFHICGAFDIFHLKVKNN